MQNVEIVSLARRRGWKEPAVARRGGNILSVEDHVPTETDETQAVLNRARIEHFAETVRALAKEHRPSRMPFFGRLAGLPRNVALDGKLLGQIYVVYQAAMHATRAGVYYMPHLDSPVLRKRKLQIYIDDDGLPGGDTHHYQLARAFRHLGALIPIGDDEFGDLGELCQKLDRATAHFVRVAKTLYSRSLGAWCIVEVMSDDWMHALASALAAHQPQMIDEPYFADCFSQGVEERHAAEALEVTEIVLRRRPELIDETLRDAKIMAEALDAIWERLDWIVQRAMPHSA